MLLHVALVSRVQKVGLDELSRVTAALQKQVLRDFGPEWDLTATVDAFASLDDVPSDYWLVTIEQFNGTGGFPGIHAVDNFQPWARVAHSNVWSLTASHEVLEMLADPFRSRLVAGAALDDPDRRVQYLVEVCDPCQDPAQAYSVNGVTVSDFVTQAYFQPPSSQAVRYSFNGTLDGPHHLADGGSVIYFDDARNEWHQVTLQGAQLQVDTLDVPATASLVPREALSRAKWQPTWWRDGIPDDGELLRRFHRAKNGVARVSRIRARALRRQIQRTRRRRRS